MQEARQPQQACDAQHSARTADGHQLHIPFAKGSCHAQESSSRGALQHGLRALQQAQAILAGGALADVLRMTVQQLRARQAVCGDQGALPGGFRGTASAAAVEPLAPRHRSAIGLHDMGRHGQRAGLAKTLTCILEEIDDRILSRTGEAVPE